MSNDHEHREDMFDSDLFEEPASFPMPEPRTANGDAAVMLAAFDRIQAAVRVEDETLGRLRADLHGLARMLGEARQRIAQAMAAGAGLEHTAAADALLIRIEARLQAMTGIAADAIDDRKPGEPALVDAIDLDDGAMPEAEEKQDPPEQDQVPTVSGVVSNLRRASDAHQPASQKSDPAASAADVQSVALLTTMVEALTATAPKPQPAWEPSSRWSPWQPIMPEVDLLSSFARMAATPFPEAEIGTAVIFAPKPPQSEQPALPESPCEEQPLRGNQPGE